MSSWGPICSKEKCKTFKKNALKLVFIEKISVDPISGCVLQSDRRRLQNNNLA